MQADSAIIGRFFSSTHLNGVIGVAVWGIRLLYALLVLGGFVALILNITKLARSNGRANERGYALYGILASGVCLAVLGGLGLVYITVISFIG